MPAHIELAGKFNSLTVLAECGKNKFGQYLVKCRCDCGNLTTLVASRLKGGHTKSCGCLTAEVNSARRTHGLYADTSLRPLTQAYYNMKTRCYNTEATNYAKYGGRGIRMCKAWYNDPQSFYSWALVNGWKKGLQVDRKENDIGYKPSNCRLVTNKVNNNNKRQHLWVTVKGERLTFSEAFDRYAVKDLTYMICYLRYTKKGYSLKEALTTPKQPVTGKALNFEQPRLFNYRGKQMTISDLHTQHAPAWLKKRTLIARLESGLSLKVSMSKPINGKHTVKRGTR